MKKSIIGLGIVIILAASYTGASWYTGNVIANNIDDSIQQINNNSLFANISLQYSDYHQGVFSTSFRLQITQTNHPDDNQPVFNDIITIYHGPLPWSELKSGHFSPAMAAVTLSTTKDSNEALWAAAGNSAFITLNATISYSDHIGISITNPPINYIDEQDGTSLQTGDNKLTIATDSELNVIDLNGQINQLMYKNSFDNIKLITKNLNYTGHFTNLSTLTNKIAQTITIEQLSIDNAASDIDFENSSDNAIIINQLNITANSNDNELPLNAKIAASIDNVTFGQQNLGKGEMLTSLSIPLTNLSQTDKPQESTIQLDKLLWQTGQGNISADITLKLQGNIITEASQLDEDNLILAQVKANLPFKTLAYLLAQINNPDKSLPDEGDISNATQFIKLYANLFLINSPIVGVHNHNDSNDNGLYMDMYYSKEQKRAKLNGQDVSLGQFWYALSHNKLPQFK